MNARRAESVSKTQVEISLQLRGVQRRPEQLWRLARDEPRLAPGLSERVSGFRVSRAYSQPLRLSSAPAVAVRLRNDDLVQGERGFGEHPRRARIRVGMRVLPEHVKLL